MSSAPDTLTPSRRARRRGGDSGVPASGTPTPAPASEDVAGDDEAPLVAPREATAAERRRERIEVVRRRTTRALRTVADVVQPLGWVLIATAVLVWWLAFAYGWREFLVVAGVVTTTLVVSLGFLFGRTTYEIGLDLTRTHVVVGERAVGGLMLANRTSRTLLPSEVILPVGAGRGVFQVPRLVPGEEHEEVFAIPTTARGVLSVGPVSVRRGDPLGLFERAHDRRQAVDLYVHPRTTTLDGLSLGHLRDLEGLPVQHLSRDDVSFHALREYQPGDDLRHVHWKSTARVGEVMVRQYEETRRSHFVVGLSTLPDEYREAEEFELAISVAGSVGLRALRDSRILDVRTQHGPVRSVTARRFLDELSMLGASRPRLGGTVALAGSIAAHAPDAAVVVLVTGARTDAAELRLACSRLPQGVRALAVVADVRVDAPALQRIGEADVVTIGALDQLPRAVRKVLS
ncbi:DUF58 domain-containing protein [Microbacterium hominis]|uniref:DUF58 domain-containing protein n=1 Tax=Microbacterium hominis TaxID=162426 RepID=UPI00077C3C62|nr:DUF58 domain-containing protein [Microbacterium hominis]